MWPQSPGISVSWEPFLCKRLLCKACQGLGALTFYFRENQRTSSRSLLGQMLTLRCRQHVFTKHRGEAITFLFILSEKQVHLSQYMPGTVVKETQRHSECRGPPEAQDSFAAPRLSPSVILHPLSWAESPGITPSLAEMERFSLATQVTSATMCINERCVTVSLCGGACLPL